MATKDLFDEPFDHGTLVKLEIFEHYAEAWIPTFVMSRRPQICIFDFFAGAGYDKNNVPGSPIRILTQVNKQLHNILKNGSQVRIFLNSYDDKKRERETKFHSLKNACSEYLMNHKDLERAVSIEYYSKDCKELFWELLPEIGKSPSLVYLDQNGVEFLADKYLFELEKLNETDFLYYVSSSYIWRFGDTPEYRTHIQIDMDELKRGGYHHVHRNVIEQLKRRLPVGSSLRLYPFSIKKDQNIFGIIFGAKHPLAVDKFLNISWKRNSENGEADFDIDGDAQKDQLSMFEERKLKKIEQFQENVRRKVLEGEISNNFQLLDYVYEEGHIPGHAKQVMMALKSSGKIDYDGTFPLVTYQNVYDKNNLMTYKVLKQKNKLLQN